MNYCVMKRLSMASNVINCIYMAVLIILAAIEINSIKLCFTGAGDIYNNVSEVSPSSPSAGYEVLINMFGSFAVGFAGILIFVLLAITVVVLLIFVAQNIVGFLLYAKIKNEQILPMKRSRAVLADAIVKCIISSLFQIAVIFLMSGNEYQLLSIFFILPQTAVTVMAVISIVFYVKNAAWEKNNS